jgi:hypothetical protein
MKICPACQTANRPEANFCSSCRTALERSSRSAYCAKGHAMHPSWQECLECKGQQSMIQDFDSVPPRMPTLMELDPGPVPGSSPRAATVIEGVDAPAQFTPAEPPYSPPAAPSRVIRSASPGSNFVPTNLYAGGRGPASTAPPPSAAPPPVVGTRRVTQYVGSTLVPAPAPPVITPEPAPPPPVIESTRKSSGRRIVGMLITYTWKPEGQIYPVREGRNLIGRHPDCDISVPEDQHLSDTNSHITFRSAFTIGDMVSMSGTDLDGTPVEENFVKLPNYSQVRTGSTHWTFIAAAPKP